MYHDLVLKWSPKINLISKSSMADIWNRHISDSAQVFTYLGAGRTCVDLGSGGGFPGLVLAILAKDVRPDLTVRMIESDVRKATFLRTVIRELDLAASVEVSRIETANPAQADVLTARALADFATLLAFSERHLAIGGKALFLKGETWEKEVEDARKAWSFDLVAHKSETNPQAAVLEVREIERV